MPYKDITYDNGFTERFYYDETEEEEALRMSRANKVSKFPSANSRSSTPKRPVIPGKLTCDNLSHIEN
ncbi:hypothetical protein N9D99_08480 [Gammaproteobacteria bacterium]|nr:hypothetical protein [Gammaproteobacteria bacterium]